MEGRANYGLIMETQENKCRLPLHARCQFPSIVFTSGMTFHVGDSSRWGYVCRNVLKKIVHVIPNKEE